MGLMTTSFTGIQIVDIEPCFGSLWHQNSVSLTVQDWNPNAAGYRPVATWWWVTSGDWSRRSLSYLTRFVGPMVPVKSSDRIDSTCIWWKCTYWALNNTGNFWDWVLVFIKQKKIVCALKQIWLLGKCTGQRSCQGRHRSFDYTLQFTIHIY